MLIVDAQIHIWKSSKPNPNHRQIADYSADDALSRGDPSAGMGSQCQRARGRGRAPTSQPVRDSRQFPARPAGEPQLDRRLERPAWDARAALCAAAAAPEDLVVGWHDGLALAGGRARWAADRAARARSATGYRSNRRAPSRTEADHRPLWQAGRNLVEPSRPHRNGQAPERGAQSHRGTELLAGALSLSRHPRPYSQALRCVRARADVLGHRHHPHADHMEAVRDDVHGGATLAARAGQRADHGARALRVACLEAAGMTAARSRDKGSGPPPTKGEP